MVDDVRKLFTTFVKEQEVALPRCGATVCLEIPGAGSMVAAMDFIKKNKTKDLLVARYIFKNHMLKPDNVRSMTDQELDDMIAKMHYDDIGTIVMAFLNVDLQKMDPEQVKALFHRMDQPED